MRIDNNSLTIEGITNRFLESHPDSNLTKKEVKTVMYLFNKLLSYWLIEKGYRYKLPHKLGYLEVSKTKMQYVRLKLDYQKWKETGMKIFHENNHSDGWYARTHWEKKSCKISNKTWYAFKLVRGNTRLIASKMKVEGGHKIYREWNSDK